MMGAFSVLMRGERSLQGDASREEAVLDPPPGDGMAAAGQSSVGIMRERPVAEEDLTMEREREEVAAAAPFGICCCCCCWWW